MWRWRARASTLDETIATVSERIEAVIAPFAEELARQEKEEFFRAGERRLDLD
jgi:hypothetical protein